MRLVVVGDFHGRFSEKLKKKIKSENADLILSIGDYLPFFYRKLWFRYCYGKDVQLWEITGKEKYKKLILKDLNGGEKVLKQLNALGIPVYTVFGNVDHPSADDVMDEKVPKGKKYWAWEYSREAQFERRLKKYSNIIRVDYSYGLFNDFTIIGARGHSFPGRVKSKGYKKHRKILENLFRKFSKQNKMRKVLFLTHNVPFKTKLDLVGSGAHDFARDRHAGSKMFRRIIEKYQPVLHFGGHIHEGKGMQKIGKTLCINPGEASKGEYVLININNSKIDVKFRKIK